MKFNHLILLAFTFLSACNSTPDTSGGAPPEETTTEEAAPSPSPANDWKSFWQKFNTAVQSGDAKTVASLTVLPLRGTEHLDHHGQDGLDAAHLASHFDDVFDAKTKARFAGATDQDFMSLQAVNDQNAELMNVPMGTEVKTINVTYIEDEGTESQTESAVIFNFAVVDGQYRLVSLMRAG